MHRKQNLIIVSGEADAVVMRINELTGEYRKKGEKVGIICTDESRAQYIGDVIESIGSRQDEDSIAQHLYAILRDFDEMDVNVIFRKFCNTADRTCDHEPSAEGSRTSGD